VKQELLNLKYFLRHKRNTKNFSNYKVVEFFFKRSFLEKNLPIPLLERVLEFSGIIIILYQRGTKALKISTKQPKYPKQDITGSMNFQQAGIVLFWIFPD